MEKGQELLGKETSKSKLMQIAELAVGLKYYEWRKVAHVIERKFSSASNKVELTDAEEIKNSLKRELDW